MARISIMAGAPSTCSVSALVLAQDMVGAPQAKLLVGGGWQAQPLHESPPPEELRATLHDLRVRVYRLDVSGLREASRYRVWVGDDRGAAQTCELKTLPASLPAEGLTIAVASCYYGGFPVHAQLAAALRGVRAPLTPSFLLMVGDNLYLDVPRPDGTPEGVVRRYTKQLLDPGYAAVRASYSTFSTWDDHELWNDYPEPQLHLGFTRDLLERFRFEQAALTCLDYFQAQLNPTPVLGSLRQGRSYCFDVPPLRFFVADTRTARTRADANEPAMLRGEELEALADWLEDPRGELPGPRVLVLGQPLWMEATHRVLGLLTADHNPPFFRKQYARLWQALQRARYDVLIISGDVHFSRLLRIHAGRRYANPFVWEFVASPLSHIPHPLWASQPGTSEIDDPRRIEAPGDPRADYVFGTEAPLCLGLLHFRPATGRDVHVTASYVDAKTRRPARAVRETELGKVQPPHRTRCDGYTFPLRMR